LPSPPQLEILDLRHFSASQLRPLLRDQAERWQRRLHWDYARASNMVLEYLDGRVLPGYVALRNGVVCGYAFCVFEASKAVIGDLYALNETESLDNPVCDTLLDHLIELLQHTPGVDRIESQLLLFPAGALHRPFLSTGFRSFPRLFMLCKLDASVFRRHPRAEGEGPPHSARITKDAGAPHLASEMWEQPPTIQSWQPEFHDAAAALIHRSYAGHMDAQLNDQYRTLHGAQRFLHNVVRFPGCGVFDPIHSLVLRAPRTAAITGLILCSRVRSDTGHITQICVDPALRGSGLGRLLLRECARRLLANGIAHLSLTVTEANTPALRLYEELGFTTMHRFEAMVWDSNLTPQTSNL
jgi:ribosomal protein S18 acetylase RimI-like enzyme